MRRLGGASSNALQFATETSLLINLRRLSAFSILCCTAGHFCHKRSVWIFWTSKYGTYNPNNCAVVQICSGEVNFTNLESELVSLQGEGGSCVENHSEMLRFLKQRSLYLFHQIVPIRHRRLIELRARQAVSTWRKRMLCVTSWPPKPMTVPAACTITLCPRRSLQAFHTPA